MSAKQQRLTLIKIIHVARRELGMDDPTYRLMLANMTELDGETSTAKLSLVKLRLVRDALKKKGFKIKSKKSAGKPHNFMTLPEAITKIEALLTDMGLTWAYADSIANQMFGIQKCAWVRKQEQLKSLIAALHVEQEKRGLLESLDQIVTNQGMTIESLERENELRAGWKRKRSTLRQLIRRYEPQP